MDQEMQAKLGQMLFKTLSEKKAEKGTLSIEDMGAILGEMTSSIQHETSSAEFIRDEFENIASRIGDAKKEIISMLPEYNEQAPDISDAHDQLDAVVKMTDEASNSIMDSADKIQDAVDKNAENMQEIVSDAVSQIFLSCNFQDLTGQRITKVVNTLKFIDERVQTIVGLFGDVEKTAATEGTTDSSSTASPTEASNRKEEEEAGLLNGPALETASQADIDALFDSF